MDFKQKLTRCWGKIVLTHQRKNISQDIIILNIYATNIRAPTYIIETVS